MRLLWGTFAYLAGIAAVCAAFYVALVYAMAPLGSAVAARQDPSTTAPEIAAPPAQAAPSPATPPKSEARAAPVETTGAAPRQHQNTAREPARVYESPPYAKWAREKALREIGMGAGGKPSAERDRRRRRVPAEALDAYGSARPAPPPHQFDLHRVY